MGRVSQFTNRAGFFVRDFRANSREKSKEIGLRILRPKKFDKFIRDPAEDRVSQILALLFVPIIIIVSLVAIVAMNEVMSEIFGVSDTDEAQTSLFGWFITGITGGLFLLAAWTWFQFVRTSGFGLFRFE